MSCSNHVYGVRQYHGNIKEKHKSLISVVSIYEIIRVCFVSLIISVWEGGMKVSTDDNFQIFNRRSDSVEMILTDVFKENSFLAFKASLFLIETIYLVDYVFNIINSSNWVDYVSYITAYTNMSYYVSSIVLTE